MIRPETERATRLLASVRDGDKDAGDRLIELLYGELHALGARHVRGGRTLSPTALVGEVWLRLSPHLSRFEDRDHFLAAASRAMRQVLANHARATRGGASRCGPVRVGPGRLGSSEGRRRPPAATRPVQSLSPKPSGVPS